MIFARRRAENEDDLSNFLGSLPVTSHEATEELDDMGRIIPRFNAEVTRNDRYAARANRRGLRQKNSRQAQDEEGYSTDATLPSSDAADYLAALQQLSRKRDKILSDVKVNEFKDPGLGIGVRFGGWRERFADSYIGAWGGLGLVGAWEFWARLELLGWNPFEVNFAQSPTSRIPNIEIGSRIRERWTAFIGTVIYTSIADQYSPMTTRKNHNWGQMETWFLPSFRQPLSRD